MLSSYFILKLLLIIPWLLALSVSDWRERRLPNWLVGIGALCALAFHIGWNGMNGLGGILLSGLASSLFLLIPFLLRGAGAGDIKLLFACGLWVGLNDLIPFLFFTSIGGLALGLGMLLKGMLTIARVKHWLHVIFDWHYDIKAGRAALPPRENSQRGVPFGIAISFGCVATIVMRAYIELLWRH